MTTSSPAAQEILRAHDLIKQTQKSSTISLLDPDMPEQELKLHMGELTEDEVLVARAAIRWTNEHMLIPSTYPENMSKKQENIDNGS